MNRQSVAIFPWGDVIEEFLGPLNLTALDFATRMRGGWLFGYVEALQRQGFAPLIVCGSEAVDRPERLEHAQTGAPIWLAPARRSGNGLARRRPSLRAVVQWIRTPLPDIAGILDHEDCGSMIIQDYEHPRFDLLAGMGRARGMRVVSTFQGGDRTASALESQVRGRTLGLCHALIVPSAQERRRLTLQYGIAPSLLRDIPNPVDIGFWRGTDKAQARQELGLPQNTFLVANHGRVDIWRKGLDVLLDAWRLFAGAAPDARLCLIGSGQDDAGFAGLVERTPQVSWMRTYVTDPSYVRRWLSAADAYVTLSRVEGMPVAPLEAMACGLPVVGSDAHGIADILDGGEASGGLIVPVGDARAAEAAMHRLYASRPCAAVLGAAARRRVAERYSIDTIGKALSSTLLEGPALTSTNNQAGDQLCLGLRERA